jgi:hypothetical protein
MVLAPAAVRPWQREAAGIHDRAVNPESRPDMTPLPDLTHGQSRSGPVRARRPVYVDLLPPCNAGCPAGENIQAWLAHAEVGHHEQAWRQPVLRADGGKPRPPTHLPGPLHNPFLLDSPRPRVPLSADFHAANLSPCG